LHLDADEGNSAGIKGKTYGNIVKWTLIQRI
jgi:propanediol utilization protein